MPASDASIFASPAQGHGLLSRAAPTLLEDSEASLADISAPAAKPRSTAQEFQARRQARQVARTGPSQKKPAPASSAPKGNTRESAFWSGEGTPPSGSSFIRTLGTTTADATGESSRVTGTDSSPLRSETDDEEQSDAPLQSDERSEQDAEETGDDEDAGDATVVLNRDSPPQTAGPSEETAQPTKQAPARRTFSLLRHSSTGRGAFTPARATSQKTKSDTPLETHHELSPPRPRSPPVYAMPVNPKLPTVASEQTPPPATPTPAVLPPREPTPPSPPPPVPEPKSTLPPQSTSPSSSPTFDLTAPEVQLQLVSMGSTLVNDVSN